MATVDISKGWADAYARNIGPFRELAERYHDDPGFRRRAEADPVAAFRENGIELPGNAEIRIKVNTDDKLYILMPPDPNLTLRDEGLEMLSGGSRGLGNECVGTLGSVGCLSCPMGTFTSIFSAGSFKPGQ